MTNLITLFKNILSSQLYTISLYSRQLAGTFVLLFIARFLSVYDYGLFSSYKSIASFLLIFANLGYNEYILVSSKNVVRDVQLKIGFFIINALGTVLIIMFLSAFTPLESYLIFILVLWRSFFDNIFFLIMLPYFQATRKFNIISYVNIFYTIVTILIAISCYLLKSSLITFLVLCIILGIINFVQVTYYTRVNYLLSLLNLKRIFNKIDKSIFAYAGSVVCSYLYMQIPSLYISTFVDKESAALFFAAFTVGVIMNLLNTAQSQQIIPEMINASVEKINKIMRYNLKFLLSIDLILLILFIIFGKLILVLLYGKTFYTNAYFLLLIIAITNFSSAFIAIYGSYITASGNQKIKIKMQVEAIIISLIVLVLLHKYGIYAATLAYFLSASHIGIRYYFKTKQLLALKSK